MVCLTMNLSIKKLNENKIKTPTVPGRSFLIIRRRSLRTMADTVVQDNNLLIFGIIPNLPASSKYNSQTVY